MRKSQLAKKATTSSLKKAAENASIRMLGGMTVPIPKPEAPKPVSGAQFGGNPAPPPSQKKKPALAQAMPITMLGGMTAPGPKAAPKPILNPQNAFSQATDTGNLTQTQLKQRPGATYSHQDSDFNSVQSTIPTLESVMAQDDLKYFGRVTGGIGLSPEDAMRRASRRQIAANELLNRASGAIPIQDEAYLAAQAGARPQDRGFGSLGAISNSLNATRKEGESDSRQTGLANRVNKFVESTGQAVQEGIGKASHFLGVDQIPSPVGLVTGDYGRYLDSDAKLAGGLAHGGAMMIPNAVGDASNLVGSKDSDVQAGAFLNLAMQGTFMPAVAKGMAKGASIALSGGMKNFLKGAALVTTEAGGIGNPLQIKTLGEHTAEALHNGSLDAAELGKLGKDAERTLNPKQKDLARTHAIQIMAAAEEAHAPITTKDALAAAHINVALGKVAKTEDGAHALTKVKFEGRESQGVKVEEPVAAQVPPVEAKPEVVPKVEPKPEKAPIKAAEPVVEPNPEAVTQTPITEPVKQPPTATTATPKVSGKPNYARGNGEKYPVEWKIRELDDLNASHNHNDFTSNPSWKGIGQPRDRSRVEGKLQVKAMAQALDAEQLLESSNQVVHGSPIVDAKGNVEHGNGRTMAIKLASESHPEQYEAYRKALIAEHPEAANFQKPVLVRERIPGDTAWDDAQIEKYTKIGTSGEGKGLSAAEVARSDAKGLPEHYWDNFEHSGDNFIDSVNSPANHEKVVQFIKRQSGGDQSVMLTASGEFSTEGAKRIERAALFHLMGEGGMKNAEKILENGEIGARIMGGLKQSLLPLLKVKTDRLSDIVNGALTEYTKFKEGKFKNNFEEYMAQGRMDAVDPDAIQLLKELQAAAGHGGSQAKVAEVFKNLAENPAIKKEHSSINQDALFQRQIDTNLWDKTLREAEAKGANLDNAFAGFGYTDAEKKYLLAHAGVKHILKAEPTVTESLFGGDTLFQGKTNTKGQYVYDAATKTGVVTLFTDADITTVLHETAHHYLHYMPENQLQAFANSLGITSGKPLNEMSKEDYHNVQEHFARGLESAIHGGTMKDANPQVQAMFDRAAKRFHDIYGEAGVPAPSKFKGGELEQAKDLGKDIANLETTLKEKHGVELRLHLYKNGDLKIDHIAVPKDSRKQGIGSAVMSEITRFADDNGLRTTLTASVYDQHYGTTSQARLKKFYKRFGFVENRGKDFSISENMLRNPKKKPLEQSNPQTKTPEFKKWFGESKVVDEKGEPLVVYHGTPSGGFSEFAKRGDGPITGHPVASHGYFFTDIPANTEAYTSLPGSSVVPTYLTMKKPKVVNMYREPALIGAHTKNRMPDPVEVANFIRKAKAAGHDGLILEGGKSWTDEKGIVHPAYREFMVFEPTQIKSAIANSGKFDPKNPSILHQPESSEGGFKLPPEAADIFARMMNGEVTPEMAKAPRNPEAPKMGETPKGEYGISNASMDASPNIKRNPGQGRSQKELIDEAAKVITTDEHAINVGRKVASGELPFNAETAAQAQAGVGVLEGKVNRLQKALDALEPGTEAHGHAKADLAMAEATLQRFTDDIKGGKSGWSDVGRVLAAKVDEMGNYARMTESVRRAQDGKPLTEQQTKQINDMVKVHEETAKELEAAKVELERLRADAELTQMTSKRSKTSPGAKNASRIEAANRRIRELTGTTEDGSMASRVLNQDPAEMDLPSAIRELANAHIHDGARGLDEVVSRIQKDLPKLPEADIVSAIAQKNAPRTVSEVQKAITELKTEARRIGGTIKERESRARQQAKRGNPEAKRTADLEGQIKMLDIKIKQGDFRTPLEVEKTPKSDKVIELEKARANAQSELRDIKAQSEAPARAAKKEAARLKDLNKQIEMLDLQMKNRDARPSLPVERQKSKEVAELEVRRDFNSRKFQSMKRAALSPKMGPARLAFHTTTGIMRFIQLGSDLGQVGRQGRYAIQHPKAFAAGLKNLGSAMKSEDRFQAVMHEIDSKKYSDGRSADIVRKDASLSTTDGFIDHEEGFMSAFAKHFPGGAPLERAQTAFMHTVRTMMFDGFYEAAHMTPKELKTRAELINSLTGRSNIKRVPSLLSDIMTSPRFFTSRYEVLTHAMRDIPEAMRGNRGAKANMKDFAANVATTVIPLMVADKILKARNKDDGVSWDFASSDFLKIRVDGHVFDISAGVSPKLRNALRMFYGFKEADPVYALKDGMSMMTGQVSPGISAPLQAYMGKNFAGFEPKPGDSKGWELFMPLTAQQLKQDIDQKSGTAMTGAALLAGIIGIGAQSYPKGQVRRPGKGKTGEKPARPTEKPKRPERPVRPPAIAELLPKK